MEGMKNVEMPVKRIFIALLALFLLAFFHGTTLAEDKVVRLHIQGCSS
jgi:hypothetical protein